ncbi:hypothetical protein IU433_00095 [Nocardia puris]|uniref:Secreted protein n=1 Tax=Nocardia puris TaxID=208602 RepID=A0A366DU37_9NOCA|nr:hypothetical protein [Nocardia puris]MBF6210187.1 hypothetical protein [Nocardia puris]MBF6367264.1 hypothetical protein [Nocardia puris]MBF6457448.1 hypothetical protein [Nocardia puris]RBO93603.1 hypothetical protein DFR74_10219 [Nocardia puris]
MVRRVLGGAFATALAATALTLAAGTAEARPADCRTTNTGTGGTSECFGGDGRHRVQVDCFGLTGLAIAQGITLPWIGGWSQLGPVSPVGTPSHQPCAGGGIPWELGVSTDVRGLCESRDPSWPEHYVHWLPC